MKTIIVKCSPVSFYSIEVIKDGVKEKSLVSIFPMNFNQTIFGLIEKNTKIYLKGNINYTEKIKEKLTNFIITKNSNFENVSIELI